MADHPPLTRERLRRINSATKYPSIETYHKLGQKGVATEEVQVDLSGDVICTEKIDGTNARIVLVPDKGSRLPHRYLIGSREEFLTAEGDLIFNPALGIVETLENVAATRTLLYDDSGRITTLYGEVYGGKTHSNSKQYTGTKAVGFRLFDVSVINESRLPATLEGISNWRKHGGQGFLSETQMSRYADMVGLEVTPRIVPSTSLPTNVREVLAWLEETIPTTLAPLDGKAGGRPEGVVVRTDDRSRIAKIRYQNYRRVK